MTSAKRIYYGGGDLLIGIYLLLNAGLVPGGYADIVAYMVMGRGAMILASSV